MKILILLTLMFSLQVEARVSLEATSKSRWVQRITSNSIVQKIFLGGAIVPLCLSLLSSCSMPHQPEAESQVLANKPVEASPPIEHAPPEAFQPAESNNPDMVLVYYMKGLGGIRSIDISDYMRAKSRLPARFYKNVLIHHQSNGKNIIGVAKLNDKNEHLLHIRDVNSSKVFADISTALVDGILVIEHDDYDSPHVKFSAMHLQEIYGKRFKKMGWTNLYAKTSVIFSNDYYVVLVNGVEKPSDKILLLSESEMFLGLVHVDHITKLTGN